MPFLATNWGFFGLEVATYPEQNQYRELSHKWDQVKWIVPNLIPNTCLIFLMKNDDDPQ
jgi:hypothetical protein